MSANYLITGASDGIGLETARLAAASGAAVLMVARNAARLQAAADSLPAAIRPQVAAVDLADPAALDAFIADPDARGYMPMCWSTMPATAHRAHSSLPTGPS